MPPVSRFSSTQLVQVMGPLRFQRVVVVTALAVVVLMVMVWKDWSTSLPEPSPRLSRDHEESHKRHQSTPSPPVWTLFMKPLLPRLWAPRSRRASHSDDDSTTGPLDDKWLAKKGFDPIPLEVLRKEATDGNTYTKDEDFKPKLYVSTIIEEFVPTDHLEELEKAQEAEKALKEAAEKTAAAGESSEKASPDESPTTPPKDLSCFLLLMIFTTPDRRAHRASIEATWGPEADDTAGVVRTFIFGRKRGYSRAAVEETEAECKDLQKRRPAGSLSPCTWLEDMEVDDSYRDLSYKSRAALRWAAGVGGMSWVYKIDDDVYLYPERLWAYLSSINPNDPAMFPVSPHADGLWGEKEQKWKDSRAALSTLPGSGSGSGKVVICAENRGAGIAVSTSGKHADQSYKAYANERGWSEYNASFYPDYCCGSPGYAISVGALQDLDGLRSLCSANEDVTVTGCWPLESKLTVVSMAKLDLQGHWRGRMIQPVSFTWQVTKARPKLIPWYRVVVIHDTSPAQTRLMHEFRDMNMDAAMHDEFRSRASSL